MHLFQTLNPKYCLRPSNVINQENCHPLDAELSSNSNIDLRAEDDAVDEAVEMIVKELNPLMYLVTGSNAGTIHVVMDERSNAADMQQRIRNLGTAVGPNNIDVTGSDVAAASAIAVS